MTTSRTKMLLGGCLISMDIGEYRMNGRNIGLIDKWEWVCDIPLGSCIAKNWATRRFRLLLRANSIRPYTHEVFCHDFIIRPILVVLLWTN
jgi:hypothetical protein